MTQINSYTNKIKTILPQMVEWFNVISTLYLIASLILSFEYQRIALYFYFTSTILDIIVNRRYQNVVWEKKKWIFVTMVSFYLCIWIWHIFENCNSSIFFHSTDIKLPFLIFGLLGIFTNVNPKIKISHIAITMLLSSIITTLYIIYDNYVFITENIKTLDDFRYNISILRGISIKTTHIESNVYMNCTMAMCFIASLHNTKKLTKILLYIGILVIYATISLSEGRAGFITVNLLLIIFITYTIYKHYPKAIAPIIILCIIVSFIGVSQHNRLQLDIIKKEPRILIWKQALKLIKERPIMGYGVCDGREKFVTECLNNEELVNNFWNNWLKKHPNYQTHRFHCHNVFIESTLEFGILGFLLTLGLFILPIILTKHKMQAHLSLFMLIFFIQSIFESFTYHFQPMLFCLIIFIFIKSNSNLFNDYQKC